MAPPRSVFGMRPHNDDDERFDLLTTRMDSLAERLQSMNTHSSVLGTLVSLLTARMPSLHATHNQTGKVTVQHSDMLAKIWS